MLPPMSETAKFYDPKTTELAQDLQQGQGETKN